MLGKIIVPFKNAKPHTPANEFYIAKAGLLKGRKYVCAGGHKILQTWDGKQFEEGKHVDDGGHLQAIWLHNPKGPLFPQK